MIDLVVGWSDVIAFFTVVAIDVALAGDNALVVGMAAAGLPQSQRKKAIMSGIALAAGMRIIFALFTVQLLQIVGLMLAGGILLLWVSWKLWREIRSHEAKAAQAAVNAPKTLRQAVMQIALADISMSLDNVLAVAGAARDHFWVLVAGLGLSVVLMGLAASLVARVIGKYHWIAYGGLLIILYVSLSMLWDGWHDVAGKLGWMLPTLAGNNASS